MFLNNFIFSGRLFYYVYQYFMISTRSSNSNLKQELLHCNSYQVSRLLNIQDISVLSPTTDILSQFPRLDNNRYR